MKLPQEFLERMKLLLGEEYETFLETYGAPRCFGLRVNTLKISAEEFERIAPFPVRRLPWIPGGYWYEKRAAGSGGGTDGGRAAFLKEEDILTEPSRHPFYYAGLYYLQEPSAMTPAGVLPVEPGERVLDLCAAPGGKATALAEKLKGRGLLVANDISASRAKALLKNLEMFGVMNAFVTNAAPPKLAEQFPLFFDKILVDAPCSGEGMFRKDAANARAWSPEKVQECARIQKGILRSAVSMLRPGGMLLYSTCTFAPEEDEQAAAYLLREFPEMELCDIPWYEGFSHGRPELGRESWQSDLAKTGPGGQAEAESAGSAVSDRTSDGSPLFGKEENVREDGGILAQLEKCVRIFPHRMRGEGHFLALFRKRERAGGSFSGTVSEQAARAVSFGDSIVCGNESGKDRPDDSGRHEGDRGSENCRAGDRKDRTGQADRVRKSGSGENRDSKYSKDSSRNSRDSRNSKDSRNARDKNGRKQSGKARGNGTSGKNVLSGTDREILREFLRDVRGDFPEKRIEVRSGQVYLVPEELPEVQGIPFLRNGLYMGEIRKDRFEPSQSFAMALRGDEYASVIAFSSDDRRVYRYLKGETIETDDKTPARAGGWQLVCADGYPLGWGKLTNGTLKNKYHSGWRA